MRRGRALAEEELLHLLHDDFLVLLTRGVQTVFVEQHLAEFHPLVPRLLRDVFVDSLAKFAIKRGLRKPRKLLF